MSLNGQTRRPIVLYSPTGRVYAKSTDGTPIISVLTYPMKDYAGDYVKPDGGDWSRHKIPFGAPGAYGGPFANWAHKIPIGRGTVHIKSLKWNGEIARVSVSDTQPFQNKADTEGIDLRRRNPKTHRSTNKLAPYTVDECLAAAEDAERLIREDIATGVSIEYDVNEEREGTDFWDLPTKSILDGRQAKHFERWNGLGYAHARNPVNPGCHTLSSLPEKEAAALEKAIVLAQTGRFPGGKVVNPIIIKSFDDLKSYKTKSYIQVPGAVPVGSPNINLPKLDPELYLKAKGSMKQLGHHLSNHAHTLTDKAHLDIGFGMGEDELRSAKYSSSQAADYAKQGKYKLAAVHHSMASTLLKEAAGIHKEHSFFLDDSSGPDPVHKSLLDAAEAHEQAGQHHTDLHEKTSRLHNRQVSIPSTTSSGHPVGRYVGMSDTMHRSIPNTSKGVIVKSTPNPKNQPPAAIKTLLNAVQGLMDIAKGMEEDGSFSDNIEAREFFKNEIVKIKAIAETYKGRSERLHNKITTGKVPLDQEDWYEDDVSLTVEEKAIEVDEEGAVLIKSFPEWAPRRYSVKDLVDDNTLVQDDPALIKAMEEAQARLKKAKKAAAALETAGQANGRV